MIRLCDLNLDIGCGVILWIVPIRDSISCQWIRIPRIQISKRQSLSSLITPLACVIERAV